MKAKIKTEVEVEIELPYFFKSSGTYAILSENLAISIYDSITIFSHASSISQHLDGSQEEITAEDFTRKYDEVLESLQTLKSNFITK